ncbi:hypothetical protein L6452_17133 [Arctium lappa]|uniref:Uncharacterized protein n=1 Tax=Arctium lappa TaxID=4217 RepID=A0ACB9C2F7_ARCLA|nr:hypothetical protein L6452_17133 [Arctium lappa]
MLMWVSVLTGKLVGEDNLHFVESPPLAVQMDMDGQQHQFMEKAAEEQFGMEKHQGSNNTTYSPKLTDHMRFVICEHDPPESQFVMMLPRQLSQFPVDQSLVVSQKRLKILFLQLSSAQI